MIARQLTLVVTIALALLAAPLGAAAQQGAKVHRIGILSSSPPTTRLSELLRQSLGELGFVEGRNLSIDWRNAEGKAERFDYLAAELVRLKVEVIVATTPGTVFAARRATRSIPIVMVNTPDPVQLGLVSSLGRPGGNITGTTSLSVDLSIKQLELLKAAVPRVSRFALVWNPTNPWHPVAVKGIEEGARSLGVQLQIFEVRGPEDFDNAFAAITRERSGAALVLADPVTFTHRTRLAALAAEHHLPTMYGLREHTEVGGLMSYWADSTDLYRRTGVYVGKILNGAIPANLPIEQPTKFEFVINLRTAKALSLTIPQALLLRADHIVE